MVNSSPMRTRNGLLYAGKKTDYWVALNPASGDKHSSVTTAGIETCTAVAQVCKGGGISGGAFLQNLDEILHFSIKFFLVNEYYVELKFSRFTGRC